MKKIFSIFLCAAMIMVGGVSVFATDSDTVIYNDDALNEILVNAINTNDCTDIDISNNELDSFIESIDDKERVSLIKDYMLLPSLEETRLQELKGLDVMERAKYLSEMPINELREASDRIRNDVDHAIQVQNERNNIEYNSLINKINSSRIAAGTYSDTLKCMLSGDTGDIAMLKCYVKWKINSSGNVVSLIPDTTTEIYNNDYEWTNNLQGTQYTTSGIGHVEKYRSFKYYSSSLSGKHTLHVKGTFGASSKALTRYERVE